MNTLERARPERGTISAAAHVACLMAIRSEHMRYQQPLPSLEELGDLAMRELTERRQLAGTETP